MDSDPNRAYLDGLKMLARRELSEMQVRTRLARRAHEQHHIDAAVARLRGEGAIDDTRTARAIARAAVSRRGLGKRRARMQVDAAGIERAIASAAVDEVFNEIDSHALLQAALTKRLRGRARIEDEAGRARLFRYLVGRGFDEERVIEALRALK
ncbi:MAG TPA: RecX family transcriptional regulator [Vicinamibacterales bacterium]